MFATSSPLSDSSKGHNNCKDRGQQVEVVCVVTTEDSMLRTLPRPWDKGIFPLLSSVCHSREAWEDPRMRLRCIFNFFPSPTREGAAAQNTPQGRRALSWKRKLTADELGSPEEGQAGISQNRNHMYAITANIQAQRLSWAVLIGTGLCNCYCIQHFVQPTCTQQSPCLTDH